MHEIRDPITFDNLNIVNKKLAWYKALGRNGVPPNSIKGLNEKILSSFCNLYTSR